MNLVKKHIIPIADILSYCLLNNHFHLLVKIKEVKNDKKVSQSFSNLFNSYSKAINKKYNRTGSLFRDRFKRIQVKEEKYLKQLIVYINLNPIYHQFVTDLSSYKHSSYLSLLSKKSTLLAREEVLLLFEDVENFSYHLQYKKLQFDEELTALILE